MSKKKRKGNKAAKAAKKSDQEADALKSLCYHGSTEEEFNNNGSEYLKAVEEYFHRIQKEARKQHSQHDNLSKKFADDYLHLMIDPDFGKFLFAWCTREFFRSNSLNKPVQRNNIKILMVLGFLVRYHYAPSDEGKNVGFGSIYMENLSKYNRDIYTDRGIINCLARETPCDCMKDGKKEAKTMDKVGYCFGCKEQFPKETLLVCSGCHDVKYHSRDCQLKYWADHKIQCRLKHKLKKEEEEMKELVDEMKSMVESKQKTSCDTDHP